MDFNYHIHSKKRSTHVQKIKNWGLRFDWKSFLKKYKLLLLGIIITLFATTSQPSFTLYLASYLLVGNKVYLTIFHNLRSKKILDENFLMFIATVGAFSIGDYYEAVSVMLLYQIGEIFQDYAVDRSRQSISDLLDLRVDVAHVVTGNLIKTVPGDQVNLGDQIIIKPGERTPLDGILIEGESYLDASALTGESMLQFVSVGNAVFAGCINTFALIKIQVTETASTSTISRILELVENAAAKKAQGEKFITKFAKIYTPVVLILALLIGVLPPLVSGAEGSVWIYRAFVFLLASCPCALVISIPLGFFAGIGGAAKQGIVIKGANYLEALNQVHTVVFDKTGTLTKGKFTVSQIHPLNISEDEFIKLAAHGESQSNHPIATSIVQAYSGKIETNLISHYKEVAGRGIEAQFDGKQIVMGNRHLMRDHDIEVPNIKAYSETVIHMIVNGDYKGYLLISDQLKATSKQAICELKAEGVNKIVMLTGDNQQVAEKVGKELEIEQVHAQLLPHQKVEEVEHLLSQLPHNKKLMFVGDGLNDAPVLARADIGVAMGGIGSDAAIEAADIVLMKDDPLSLVRALHKSRQTKTLLYQNIVFAIGIKVIIMGLSLFGLATMWLAVFGDVGVTILAVLNSIRAIKEK